MIIYALKSILCLIIFWTFYKLVLEQERMFDFNRGYLIISLIGSFSFPMIRIPIHSPLIEEVLSSNIDFLPISVTSELTSSFDLRSTMLIIYFTVVLIFLVKLLTQLWEMHQQTNKAKPIDLTTAKLIIKDDINSPYTFMRYIFMPVSKISSGTQEDMLLLHELAHARQAHSLDIIFVEILKAIFWFNPIILLVKKSIKLNHEFLADAAVLNENHNLYNYQQILLSVSTSKSHDSLSSQLNYSITKKRLEMMTKETSTWISISKICMSLVLTLCLCIGLCESLYAQGPGVSAELIKEYEQLVEKVFDNNGQIMRIKKADADRMSAIYASMNADQQSKFSDYQIPPTPPVPPSPQAVPTAPAPPVPAAAPAAPLPPAPPAPPSESLFPENAQYFIDGKSVSKKEAKKAYANRDQIAEINVKKLDNGEYHVYFISK